MDISAFRRKCDTCYDFEEFRTEMPLVAVRQAASEGCLRCALLHAAAMSFKDNWAGDIDGGSENLVKVMVSKSINGDNGPRIAGVQWPCGDDNSAAIPIHITTEERHPLLGTSIAIARRVYEHSSAPGCLDFLRSQLRICEESHDNCGQDVENSATSPLPERLLRISASSDGLAAVLTKTAGGPYKYTALSHCWGSPKDAAKRVPRTTAENAVAHETTGVPNAVLSRTFRDAIDLTWKLGVEHIWIDSLCIIQDDADHKARELCRMDSIYRNACLVIAATLAGNTDHGLYHPRSRSSFTVADPAGGLLKARACGLGEHSIWNTCQGFWAAPGLPLLYRAWAFQERLLARRVAHFTPEELVWECRTHVDCECGELLRPTMHLRTDDDIGKSFKTTVADAMLHGGADTRLRLWCDIGAQYSARDITFSSDRLPALASVARQLDGRGGLGRYFAGIWEHSLPAGLLWHASCKENHGRGATSHWRPEPRPAPTWSWLGIQGWVSLRHDVSNPLASVLDVQYVLSGPDEYGPCKLGILHLAARMVDVEIVQGDGYGEWRVRRQDDGETCDFNADTNPFEYSVNDLDDRQVAALELADDGGFTDVIVLRLIQPEMRHFERLGTARCPTAWLSGAAKRTISVA